MLAFALLCSLAFAVSARAPSATRVVGSVRVQERALFSGLRERDDRSGIVVYLTGFSAPGAPTPSTLGQRDERFEPKVLPVVVGQKVEFPNFDRLYHNVFSVSPVKSFDLGQYKSTDPPRSVVFDKPGLVPVFCNIHPHMISYVVVLENPSWAVTGADGAFDLRGAPPGRVTVNAWLPGAPARQPRDRARGRATRCRWSSSCRPPSGPCRTRARTAAPTRGPATEHQR